MSKTLLIAEKPSVAKEFAKVLGEKLNSHDGYLEGDRFIVTWCVGHLVSMSYPEVYDEKYKKWSFDTIPFLPTDYKYEVIGSVKKQFDIVKNLLTREDVSTIYVCTDSGREGEYIYRLVRQEAGVTGKTEKRVWIDSQTEEEMKRGLKEAKDISAYDSLSDAAYLRAKEDYLMGINFSRALTLKYGYQVKTFLNAPKAVISVGRVMTCVLGMVVKREREIRDFVKTPFYRVIAKNELFGQVVEGEFRAIDGSKYFQSPVMYKENGFKKEEDARGCIEYVAGTKDWEKEDFRTQAEIVSIEKKPEKKNPPLLYNLAEIQNDCSKLFKINPDQTLAIIQELYEKKLVTYPRTDARVLSTAVAKEIDKNIKGLMNYPLCAELAKEALELGLYKKIATTKYVNDKQITDHYAIIPTGQGFGALNSLNPTAVKVYEIIVRRFLSIFFPPAVFEKLSIITGMETEKFFTSFKAMKTEGYLKVTKYSFAKDASREEEKDTGKEEKAKEGDEEKEESDKDESQELKVDEDFLKSLSKLKKGDIIPVVGFAIKEGMTSPPKRYNSGSLILAMESAGQFIEDEDLRAQIKGSGIGTSATRAGILTKLVNNKYLNLNKKTQIITPTLLGEMVHDVVLNSIRSLLNPSLTASWEKGLTMVAEGEIGKDEYMNKLSGFVADNTNMVKSLRNQNDLNKYFVYASKYYKHK
ncbi:MAG: type IA DNA topoisomerase [Lachnospiraceae bacterium]|nr:type IA DNA topoisomerase [Lachnospiraceae bacterium]